MQKQPSKTACPRAASSLAFVACSARTTQSWCRTGATSRDQCETASCNGHTKTRAPSHVCATPDATSPPRLRARRHTDNAPPALRQVPPLVVLLLRDGQHLLHLLVLAPRVLLRRRGHILVLGAQVECAFDAAVALRLQWQLTSVRAGACVHTHTHTRTPALTCCAAGKRLIAVSYTPVSAMASWYVMPARTQRCRRHVHAFERMALIVTRACVRVCVCTHPNATSAG